MSTINNIGASDSVHNVVNNPVYKSAATDTSVSGRSRSGDSVEISAVSQFLQTLQANPIREDKVASIRAQIAAGTYETPEKLDAAANNLLDELK